MAWANLPGNGMGAKVTEREFRALGRCYRATVITQHLEKGARAPRLIAVTFMPNEAAVEISHLMVLSIMRYTRIPFELWVVDNLSPEPYLKRFVRLLEGCPVNLILNRTEPLPPLGPLQRAAHSLRKLLGRETRFRRYGSLSNAVGLAMGRVLSAEEGGEARHLFVMHNDVLVTHERWLEYLLSRFNEKVRGVAICQDNLRVRAMHCSGFCFDDTLFDKLGMHFFPDWPKMAYDTGDMVSLKLMEYGYEYFVCPNTFNHPELADRIPRDSPFRISSDRVFDDDFNVIYMHLGRGTLKSMGAYPQKGRASPLEWIRFARGSLGL